MIKILFFDTDISFVVDTFLGKQTKEYPSYSPSLTSISLRCHNDCLASAHCCEQCLNASF